MRKLLLITTALVAFSGPVHADPVTTAISGFATWVGTLGPVGQALVKIGASVLLSTAANALTSRKGPRQQDIIRELHQPTSLPVYRFVYGKCWAPGTPAPVRVKGNVLYACYILNSRPSEGPFTVYLDKRQVAATGDPYDFGSSGATATNDPFSGHCQYWIGRGEQDGPPAQILSEAPEHFTATDAWKGRTVVWFRLIVGDNDSRMERWPATPPEVMVDGRWSLVSDPRDPSAPPVWSNNQALCVLDALKNNPLRPYDDRNLWLETFGWAATEAAQPLPNKAGDSIHKFRVNGVLAFSEGSELEDQVAPLVNAGASSLIRVGGRLGLVPAVYQEPVMTVSDVLDDQPMTFNRYRPSGELVTAVTATYTSPDRMYEDASTPIYTLAGAQEEDGGTPKLGQYDLAMVTDHRQAQYVAAIMGRRTRMQRSWSGVLPGEAFDLVAGSTVALDLPAPYTRRNGVYQVEQIHPGFDPVGLDGVAMRCPASLRETSPAIYEWDPATDEQDVIIEDFDASVKGVQPPGAVDVTSGSHTTLIAGDTHITRVRFTFSPSPSASTVSYRWQYQNEGEIFWERGGEVDTETVNADGDMLGHLAPAVSGRDYRIRVQTVALGGASEWITSGWIEASAGEYLAPAPEPVSAIGGDGEIAVTFKSPNDSDYRAIKFYVSETDDSGAATLLAGPIYTAANTSVTENHTGLGVTQTRYYFARSVDRNGSNSPFSASISATTT